MIAKFLTEKFTISTDESELKKRMKEFDSLERSVNHYYDTRPVVLADNKPSPWFYARYHEGQKDAGNILCFAVIDSGVFDERIANRIHLAFQADYRRKREDTAKEIGRRFYPGNKEEEKRSSAFIRNLVKKLASLSTKEQMVALIRKTALEMEDFDWSENRHTGEI